MKNTTQKFIKYCCLLLLCIPFTVDNNRFSDTCSLNFESYKNLLKYTVSAFNINSEIITNSKLNSNVTLSENIPQDWWAQVQQGMVEAEYEINWQKEKHTYSSPNRAQNLRFDYFNNGFLVTAREEKIWEVKMNLSSFGKEEMKPFKSEKFSHKQNKGESDGKGILITYENTKKGMQQNFIVKEKPNGDHMLKLEIEVTSDLDFSVQRDRNGIGFSDAEGQLIYQYKGLQVFDANGRDLAAEMVKNEAGFSIIINDMNAVYPILIDPLSTSANWVAESNQVGSYFGYSVASAGDVNGDGFSDVIVGAKRYDNGQTDEGGAFVFYGSSVGLSDIADWQVESDQAEASFGASVSNAGDVNGDGFSDVIIGAYQYDNAQDDNVGASFLYYGSTDGLSLAADWVNEGNQAEEAFGASVSSGGDINGDGYSDVIIGAYGYDNGQLDEGAAYVYFGGSTGISAIPDWTAESNQRYALFGFSVASAGDVNGDGFSDIIVGAQGYENGESSEGAAFVYHGSAIGLPAIPNWTAEGNQEWASFSYSLAGAGDVNNDGFSDVIIGAHGYANGETQEGAAFVYYGSLVGLSAIADWSAESDQLGANFGVSVSGAGDVNGDGISDVIVGAYKYDNGESNEGAAFAYYGSSTGLSGVADWSAESNYVDSYYGYSVSSAGDVNGDGYSDLIVGAYLNDSDQIDEGSAFVYYGSGTVDTPSQIDVWNTESNQINAFLGTSVSDAGDINGDGFSDVIVGAPGFDNGHTDEGITYVYYGSTLGLLGIADWSAEGNQVDAFFGSSVSSAGDVNGDGYSDVIIGAYGFENSHPDEGFAFVYYGSSSGLSVLADWTAEGDQLNAYFGASVSSAGDVNGDGYSDVIIGAYLYDNGETDEGSVFVYYGSSTGLSAVTDWTEESNQAYSYYGGCVANAGDVNGDGYSDVVVGAYYYDNEQSNEGAAFVYYGSAIGLSTEGSWKTESNYVNSYYGYSVSSAGDVNGDGFSDLIVGAYSYDIGGTNAGAAFLYYGSTNGLSLIADWSEVYIQANAYFGTSVANAGDVNGDGFSDIIIGASGFDNAQAEEGAFFVYYGSPVGLSVTTDWAVESNHLGAYFGTSVSSAGDVNGDGFSDVIVGAKRYNNGQSSEGASFLYYGNKKGGTLRPLLFREDLTTPIAITGRTHSTSAVAGALFATSFMGRMNIKAQFEVKELGKPFDGNELTESSDWVDSDVSGTLIKKIITGLSSGRQYKARMRIKYSPVYSVQPHGRWLYIQGNGGLGETDFIVSNVGDIEPDIQATDIVFSNLSSSSMTLDWTAGNGTKRIIVARETSVVSAIPIDGRTYSAAAFGSGSELSVGEYIVYNGSGIQANITGLKGNTEYHFKVFEYLGDTNLENYFAETSANNQNSQFTLINSPVALNATSVGPNSFTANWEAVPGADNYYLQVSVNADLSSPINGYDGTVAILSSNISKTVSGLSPGIEYYYRLSAENTVGKSSVSNTISQLTYPASPIATNATSITQSSFDANWNTVTSVDNYYLEVSTDSDVSSPLVGYDGTVPISAPTIITSVSGLSSGVIYYYRVTAENPVGLSGISNIISQITIPANPLATNATSVSQRSFTANWNAVSGADNYFLEVSVNSDLSSPTTGYDGTVPIPSSNTSVNVSDLSTGTTYYYRIAAENTAGKSGASNIIQQITVPEEPIADEVINVDIGTTAFIAKWQSVTGTNEYEVEVSSNNFTTLLAGYNPFTLSSTDLQITGLLPETTYKFRVRAKNNAGISGYSNVISLTTLSESLTSISIGNISYSSRQDNLTTQTLNISVSGGVHPYSLVLNHKGILEASFIENLLTEVTTDNYSFNITPAMLDEIGVDFEVIATDAASFSDTKNGKIFTSFDETQSPAIPFEFFGGTDQSWNLFSIPYELDNKAIGSIFVDFDPSRHEYDWRIVHYRNSTNDYVNFNTGQTNVGEAYWFNSKENLVVKVGAGQVTSNIPFTKSLSQGWNLIGNPYPVNISWEQVILDNPTVTGVESLQVFNGRTQSKGDIITAFSGGFVWSDEAIVIEIDPHTANIGGRVSSNNRKIESDDIDLQEWMLDINLITNNNEEKLGGFGMHPEASILKDQYDAMVVPRFIVYTELFTQHQEYFYPWFATDIVPTSTDHTWEFTLSSNEGHTSTLKWDQIALQDKEAKLFLLDKTSGKLIDMKLEESHEVDFSRGDIKFEIYFSSSDNLLLPNDLILGTAYPNPANTAATIPVVLPAFLGDRRINLSIYDLNGKLVTTLADGNFAPGIYEFVWDIEASTQQRSSGMFIYQLLISDGSIPSSQKKLIVR